jgi:hypothetical protein
MAYRYLGRLNGDPSASGLLGLVGAARAERRRQPPVLLVLLNFCTAALNQHGQNDHNQNTSYDPNDQGTVHNKLLVSCNYLLDALPV